MAQLVKRADDLESQLNGLPKKSSTHDEKAARLRSHLCEVLSDILITDPILGMEHDGSGRLWRNCFYTPIGIWRNRISREKRKQGPNLATFEQSFKKFLSEAIMLYEFLIAQYKSKLLPPSARDASSQDASQLSLSSSSWEGAAEGVVPGLYRLFIHMGDLHRYAESYSKAETYYLNASKLSPGMGNPYNQLAVVAQMKDSNMSCVALYWYARSLLATHDSFETSSSNLDRLFTSNRNHLKEHSRDFKPPVLPAVTQPNKKGSTDMVRAQKAAASKSCLAHFVDFHFDLIQSKPDQAAAGHGKKVIQEKMDALDNSLRSLLRVSAYGDALLCKMVVIATFSFEMNKNNGPSPNHHFSSMFLFALGATLGEQLQTSLSKITEKNGKGTPSIRLLIPFGILCEYIDKNFKRNGSHQFDSYEKKFWNVLTTVANLIGTISQKNNDGSHPTSSREQQQQNQASVALKEYKALKGYRPYSFLFETYLSQEPFVTPLEAVDVLELYVSQTQDSTSAGSSADNEKKVMRFNKFLATSITESTYPVVRRNNNYEFIGQNHLASEEETKSSAVEGEAKPPDAKAFAAGIGGVVAAVGDTEQFECDDAGDVVLYAAPESSTGAVPPDMGLGLPTRTTDLLDSIGMAPSGQVGKVANVGIPTVSSDRHDKQHLFSNKPKSDGISASPRQLDGNVGSTHRSKIVPPPGIMPPPGFGTQTAQPAPFMPMNVAPVPAAFGRPLPIPTGQPVVGLLDTNQQQLHSLGGLPSYPSNDTSTAPLGQNPPNMPHPVPWFSAPEVYQTRNPFAPPVNVGFANPARPTYESDTAAVDGASLLGTGLLDSLWMNDGPATRTKNPFAANRD